MAGSLQLGQTQVKIIAEQRGNNEDQDLKSSFLDFTSQGNVYMPRSRVRAIDFQLEFAKKSANITGLQLADLAAYPIARQISRHGHPHEVFGDTNKPYAIVRTKFYQGPGRVLGIKIFPEKQTAPVVPGP